MTIHILIPWEGDIKVTQRKFWKVKFLYHWNGNFAQYILLHAGHGSRAV
jgi:hypothetical protein